MAEQPPPDRLSRWLTAVKGLTVTNAIVILLLLLGLIPSFVIYKAVGDEKLLDRLLSTYEEKSSQQVGCTLRHAQQRGGPDLWSISTGFAFRGEARWFISVATDTEPTIDELQSYCEVLKLIADKMLEGNDAS
jgi:hypothetical protein